MRSLLHLFALSEILSLTLANNLSLHRHLLSRQAVDCLPILLQNPTDSDSALSSADEEAFAEHPQESQRKFPMQEWIADTDASTHITDQLHLFRGP
jgi:hypothetical protein